MTRVGVVSVPVLVEAAHAIELLGHAVVSIDLSELAGEVSQPIECLVAPMDAVAVNPGLRRECDRAGVRLIACAVSPSDIAIAPTLGIDWVHVDDVAQMIPAVLAGVSLRTSKSAPRKSTVIALWGPAGAAGVSLLTANLATECAIGWDASGRGRRGPARPRVTLIDLDCWAPSLAPLLGATPEVPGVVAAARLAETGGLDESEFYRLASITDHGVRLLTGLSATSRWTELTAERVVALFDAVRAWSDVVFVDLGSHTSREEVAVLDPLSPRRTAAAEAAAGCADVLVAVGAGDPISLARLVRTWPAWEALHPASHQVVINKVRRRAIGPESGGQIRRVCEDFIGVTPRALLPVDGRAADESVMSAGPLASIASKSALRVAVRSLAQDLFGGVPKRRRDASAGATEPIR